jgi:hypothetical protein
MKKMIIISVTLLCSPMVNATLPNTTRLAYQINDEQTAAHTQNGTQNSAINQEDEREQEAEDAFDALMEDEDVPKDMLVPAKPVSACEAYFKEIGVQILMKYITFKVWLERHWQSLTK